MKIRNIIFMVVIIIIICFILYNIFRFNTKETIKYSIIEYYKPFNHKINFALVLIVNNTKDKDGLKHIDVIKYYVDTLKFPKENLFIIDSSGKGAYDTYIYKQNQLIYNQDKYQNFIDNLILENNQFKYEMLALILSSKYFDFTSFKYVIKLTCEYKIPELYMINDIYTDSDLLIQENSKNNKIFGIKGIKFRDIIYTITQDKKIYLEEIFTNFSKTFLPFLSNIYKYKSKDKSFINILNNPNIPKIINKVIITNNIIFKIDDNIKDAHNSWTNLNRDYVLKIWNLNDCRSYLINNFHKEIIETFDNIIPYSYKCDFFRYCLIYKEGGWYSDWKEVCLINNLLNKLNDQKQNDFVCFYDKNHSFKTYDYEYTMTGFFGACKYHPILREIINMVIYNYKNNIYGDNQLFPTGPALLGKIMKKCNFKPQGYFKDNFYYNNIGKIIQHKCSECSQDQNWSEGNNYGQLWLEKKIYKTSDNFFDIPKKIYQTYITKSLVPNKVFDSIKKYAPEYKYYFFSDKDCIMFIKDNFPPNVLSVYNNLENKAHKADLFRYCVLYINGGIYLDIKTVLIKPLKDIFKERYIYSSISIVNNTIHQGIIAAPPKNKFFLDLIEYIINIKTIDNYHVFTSNFYTQIKKNINNKKILPGVNSGKENFYLFEEKCTIDKNDCVGGSLDRYERCCYIYDKDEKIFGVRYSDFPWI